MLFARGVVCFYGRVGTLDFILVMVVAVFVCIIVLTALVVPTRIL